MTTPLDPNPDNFTTRCREAREEGCPPTRRTPPAEAGGAVKITGGAIQEQVTSPNRQDAVAEVQQRLDALADNLAGAALGHLPADEVLIGSLRMVDRCRLLLKAVVVR